MERQIKYPLGVLIVGIVFSIIGFRAFSQPIPASAAPDKIRNEIAKFDEATGTLEVPVIITGSESSPGQVFRRVVFKLNPEGLFSLESYQDVKAEEECTSTEIEQAFPQLNLSQSLEEMEDIIGCPAVISFGETDLENGLLVTANWAAADGIPFQALHETTSITREIGPFTIPTPAALPLGSEQRVQTNPYLFRASNGPFISIDFREGSAISARYSYRSTYQFQAQCDYSIVDQFHQLTANTDLAGAEDILACAGTFNETTISIAGESSQFSWRANSFDESSPGVVKSGSTVEVIAKFRGNSLLSKSLYESGSVPAEGECTIEQITQASLDIEPGMSIPEVAELIPCGSTAWGKVINNDLETTTIQWQTSNPTQDWDLAMFQTLNRFLFVTFEDNKVESVELIRG